MFNVMILRLGHRHNHTTPFCVLVTSIVVGLTNINQVTVDVIVMFIISTTNLDVSVCLQNWTNFCPYGLNSTPIST